ncbi:MAG: DUF2284 domain-containing protein [Deltaproteobacteria bacterium]|nr:DUF2284 domain-containing protein [Deltaproteobacteria bacterium]
MRHILKRIRESFSLNTGLKNHLTILTTLALNLGATRVKPIKVCNIVVDERVRLKCTVPLCIYYGKNLMCPPNVMEVEEFKKLMAKYTYAILIQFEKSFSEEMLKIIDEHENLETLFLNDKFDECFKKSLSPALSILDEIISRVEAKAFMLGHKIAVGYNVGPCVLCDECIDVHTSEPCRHPYKARTSMEAMGINVFETAKKIGFEFEQPAKNIAVFNGLVLVE